MKKQDKALAQLEWALDVWKQASDDAEKRREQAAKAVSDCVASGITESELQRVTGLSRGTIRRWQGKA